MRTESRRRPAVGESIGERCWPARAPRPQESARWHGMAVMSEVGAPTSLSHAPRSTTTA